MTEFEFWRKSLPFSRKRQVVNPPRNSRNVCLPSAFKAWGKIIVNEIANIQTPMEAKSARRIVTIVWYLNANLTAITRSTLINARWRMMLALREKLRIDLPMHSWRRDFSKTLSTTCKMKTATIKRSTSAKLTKMLFDAVRRFGNFKIALMTIQLPKSVASARKELIQTKKTFISLGADRPRVVEFMIQKTLTLKNRQSSLQPWKLFVHSSRSGITNSI